MANRPFVAAHYWLQLDGFDCGTIKSYKGGDCKAEVAELAQNGGYWVKKHITTIKYEPIKIEFGGIQSGPIYDRIKEVLAMKHQYVNGAIHNCDFDMKTKATKEFNNALITEFSLPAIDASSKDAGYLSVTFTPEKCRHKKGDDKGPTGATNVKQKKLSPANFRITVDKVGADACRRITKADTLTTKCGTTTDATGPDREYELVPAKGLQYPNLSVTVPTVDIDPWEAWFEDFVLNGNCGEDKETTAELVYLDQARGTELLKVTMYNVGIFGMTIDEAKDQADGIHRSKIDMYMERLSVDLIGA